MTKKKDGNRFDNLFSAAREPKPTTKAETEEAATAKKLHKKSKSSNPYYMRTTVYLPKKLHRQLKSAAADEEREISEIVEELVANWLASRKDI